MYLQLAEDNYLAASCGLPPVKPLRGRSKVPEKWAEYDRKKADWDACREGKGKPTSIHPLRKILLAPGRALFLALLDHNVDGLASRLATQNVPALSAQWRKLGGDPRKLVDFINKGKKKAPKRHGFLKKFTGPQALADGEGGSGAGEENPAALSADQKAKIITASTALGVALGATIPAIAPVAIPGGPILGTVIVGIMPFIKNAANKTDAEEAAGALIPDAILPPTEAPGQTDALPWLAQKNFTGLNNGLTLMISTGIVGAVGAAVSYKRNKKKQAATIGIGAAAVITGILLYERSQANN